SLPTLGFAGNAWTAQVALGVGLSLPLSVGLSTPTTLLVTLGTDGAGAPDPAQNRATTIAAAINALATALVAVASGTGLTALTLAEGPHAFTGGSGNQSLTFTIAASTFGSVAIFLGSPLNLDTLTGGDNDVKGDDYIHFWVRADHPERLTFVQIDVDVDALSTSVADSFRHNY